jgi:hypothetical protein
LFDGAVHLTVAAWFTADADTFVGGLGTVAGVRSDEVVDTPAPFTFTALRWIVYATPWVSPLIVPDFAVAANVWGFPAVDPLYGVAWYAEMAAPPSCVTGTSDHVRVIVVGPVDHPVMVGAVSGVVDGVTGVEKAENCPVPWPFAACTSNLYAVPFVSDVTVQLVVVTTAGEHVLAPGVLTTL